MAEIGVRMMDCDGPDARRARLFKTGWGIYQHAQNPLCDYCDKPIPADGFTVDHISPLLHARPEKRGKDSPRNYALACRACNKRKGNRLAAEVGMRLIRKRNGTPECDKAMVQYATSAAIVRRVGRQHL